MGVFAAVMCLVAQVVISIGKGRVIVYLLGACRGEAGLREGENAEGRLAEGRCSK